MRAEANTKLAFARVVHVPDRYHANEVVINRGAADGVKVGDRFIVYGIGPEIFDPETKESLGRLEILRGRGIAMHVQERLTTLRSIEKSRPQITKRVIRRSNPLLIPETVEETVPDTAEDLPFEAPMINDAVRPI